jgi:hypothetical protein
MSLIPSLQPSKRLPLARLFTSSRQPATLTEEILCGQHQVCAVAVLHDRRSFSVRRCSPVAVISFGIGAPARRYLGLTARNRRRCSRHC